MSIEIRVEVLTENTGIVYLGDDISEAISRQTLRANEVMPQLLGAALLDTIPAYCSVHFTLDPLQLRIRDACERLRTQLPTVLKNQSCDMDAGVFKLHSVPVCYHPDLAPDLLPVSARLNLSIEEVIRIHSGQVYRVYAMGFAPGFCFLGALDPRLRIPRRATPRSEVPAGSVAIASEQTAVYPCETPGGWHILGRTPIDMLALCQDAENGIQVGDRIEFYVIELAEFQKLSGVSSEKEKTTRSGKAQ